MADRLPGVVTEDITAKALYEIEEAAHDWQLIETIWITDDCDSYGTAKYVCLNCGEQKEELATPRWHDISEEDDRSGGNLYEVRKQVTSLQTKRLQ